MADKLLLTTAYVVLSIPSLNHGGTQIPPWVTILVIARDVLIVVVALVLYLAAGVRKFPPSVLSKINTILQVVAVALVLVSGAFPDLRSIELAADGTLYLVAGLTVASGLYYIYLYTTAAISGGQAKRNPKGQQGLQQTTGEKKGVQDRCVLLSARGDPCQVPLVPGSRFFLARSQAIPGLIPSWGTTMSDFVHLHLHSQFSLLDGANRLDDVIKAAVEAGMPAMALTDHGNMFGAIEFYNKARAAGIKPIVGMEAYVAQGSRLDRTPGRGSSNHLVLLAKDETGYRNLLKLTSGRLPRGVLLQAPHRQGAAAPAQRGADLPLRLPQGGGQRAHRRHPRAGGGGAPRKEFLEIFGEGNFYLEMQDHGIPEQRLANEVVRRIRQRNGIPLVVTNDCHYLRKDDAFAHDVLLCIGTPEDLRRPRPPALRLGQLLHEVGRGDAQDLPRRPLGDREHPGDRRAVQPGDPHRDLPPARVPGARRATPSRATSTKVAREGLGGAARRAAPPPRRRGSSATPRRPTGSAWTTRSR